MFTAQDQAQIASLGLSEEGVQTQIENFKSGFPSAKLVAPALLGDGLTRLDGEEINECIKGYENTSAHKSMVKFVPASGAASRMFKNLFSFLADYSGSDEDYQKMITNSGKGSPFEFFKNIEKFGFYEELRRSIKSVGHSISELQLKREYVEILNILLSDHGMNYGSLPKGLLIFHRENNQTRTPVEEHIVEGCQYAKDRNGRVAIHFTVSPEHLDQFKAHVDSVKGAYEDQFGCQLTFSFSGQNPATDTIAVDMENKPVRTDGNKLVFRPAGHGALLENLNNIDADLIFLKNIDNVVPDKLKPQTILYKKVLGGVLLKTQAKIHGYLNILDQADETKLRDIAGFINKELGYRMTTSDKGEIKSVLDRPIRVCGMVQADGDPGGGPFWVKGENGEVSLQIVETAQVALHDEPQRSIFRNATHFNPVDLVCAVRDYKGDKFDLLKYRDENAAFITEKSKGGKTLKAMELPGLWNGAMAHWNTIFVEVPLITFNPVKTVNDLLRPEHQG